MEYVIFSYLHKLINIVLSEMGSNKLIVKPILPRNEKKLKQFYVIKRDGKLNKEI